MIRKIIAVALMLILTLSITSCSKMKSAGREGVILPLPKDGKAELTILISSNDYSDLSANSALAQYTAKFKRDFGVDVKFEQIKTSGTSLTDEARDEYLKKLFVKLTAKDGPDLIYNRFTNLEPLVEQGAVADMRGKVENLDKIYESLLTDKMFYAPLGVTYYGMIVNRDTLAKLGTAEPGMNWMPEDFYAVRDKWIINNKMQFTRYEYIRTFEQFIDLGNLYKADEKKLVLNTPELRRRINDTRSYIFGGTYQLINGYNYENYYNMLFESDSEEWKKSEEIWSNQESLDHGVIANVFRAQDLQEWIKEYAIVKVPSEISRGVRLGSYGFLVNKNARNLDLAYEFINGLLSNEVQMTIFESKNNYFWEYPVNKEIEADILKLEAEAGLDPRAIQVKAFALQELKNAKCILLSIEKNDMNQLEEKIYKDLAKFILADKPYSDEQLQMELKKLEDKYNIYLNE